MKIEVQRKSQIEKEKTRDANTKCEKETVNRLECQLSGSVVVLRKPKKTAYTGDGVREETVRGGESVSVGVVDMCRALNETERAWLSRKLTSRRWGRGTEVGDVASGAAEQDGKTVLKRWFKFKIRKWMIHAATIKEKCWRSFVEAGGLKQIGPSEWFWETVSVMSAWNAVWRKLMDAGTSSPKPIWALSGICARTHWQKC